MQVFYTAINVINAQADALNLVVNFTKAWIQPNKLCRSSVPAITLTSARTCGDYIGKMIYSVKLIVLTLRGAQSRVILTNVIKSSRPLIYPAKSH